jgi:cellulose synthase/poly-beta-1,6-N-acetylglucosamine synthase-like glycosyltransferase
MPKAQLAVKRSLVQQAVAKIGRAVPAKMRSAAYVVFRRCVSLPSDLRATVFAARRTPAIAGLPPTSHTPPLVSIITRTVGQDATLFRGCLASVARQTYAYIEHVVVEDGTSTMKTICEDEQMQSQGGARRIRYLACPKLGRAGAANEGLAIAGGELILFLDDDDVLYPQCIQQLVGALTENDVAAIGLAHRSRRVRSGPFKQRDLAVRVVREPPFTYELLRKSNLFPIQSVLFRRSRYEDLGGFRDLEAFEDWNLWLRYLKGQSFAVVPHALSMYREPASLRAEIRLRRFMADRFPAVARQNRIDGVGPDV